MDYIIDLVNEYLRNDWDPTATKVTVDGQDYIAYTINGYPFIIDSLDLIFIAMEKLENDQEWKKR